MSWSCQTPLIRLAFLFSCLSLSTSQEKLRSLTTTQPLLDGDTLVSAGGIFALGFFTPAKANNGNRYVGIWYHNITVHTVVWVANRRHPVNGTDGKLLITTNGTVVITEGNSSVIWSSAPIMEVSDPVAHLLDTGNFVVTDKNDLRNFAWQSYDYPTDTLLPGMKLGWNLTSRLNCNLTSWSSDTDPSPGIYSFAMDLRGDPQVILWAGSSRVLRSGPWNGVGFSSLVSYEPSYIATFMFRFVNNKEEVFTMAEVVNSSALTRLVMNSSGSIQQFIWLSSGQWVLYTYAPSNQCHSYHPCGPSGSVCYPDGSTKCSCLQGFLPKSPANWELRDWAGGCVRKTPLDCRNKTYDFVPVQKTMLPDTVSATVDMKMSLDECKAECLRNCSCIGFASADIRAGAKGCIMWSSELSDVWVYAASGQDLYMKLAAADIDQTASQSKKSKSAPLAVVLGAVLGSFGMLLLVGVVCFCIRRRRKPTRGDASINEEKVADNTGKDDMELPLYDLETLVKATNNFSSENKLGEGGFGPVYKGKLREGQAIAVKRLSKTSVQGLNELMTEVELVAKLQHRNLVKLLGCCIQGHERMLIYEYMPNKSLDAFLFDTQKAVLLDWGTRYQIIIGIARGLLYLHQDSRYRIIHRDLKASNVLLDKDMNPKISDFGLARIFGEDVTDLRTRRVAGTFGYMSPEYAMDGIFSMKSDVYSFGVLILEIISGQQNKGVYFTNTRENLLGKAWTLWEDGNDLQLLDPVLGSSLSMTEVLRCIKVGLLCIQEYPEDRPTMSSVLFMLNGDVGSLPEPKQPGYVARRNFHEESTSSKQSDSVNDLTITLPLGR